MSSSGSNSVIPLDWSRRDIEQRFGFPGGRFTRTNNLFTGIVAILLSISFYAAIMSIQGTWFGDMWTKRGPTPYAIIFFFLLVGGNPICKMAQDSVSA